jgi:hypothetical protein
VSLQSVENQLVPKTRRYFVAPQGLDDLAALLLNGNKPVLKHVFLRKHEVSEVPSQCIDGVCRSKTVEFIDQFVKEILM